MALLSSHSTESEASDEGFMHILHRRTHTRVHDLHFRKSMEALGKNPCSEITTAAPSSGASSIHKAACPSGLFVEFYSSRP